MGSRTVVRFVTIKKFGELTGYSEDAVRSKIKRGEWLRDHMYRKGSDGRILMDIEAFNDWADNGMPPFPQLLDIINRKKR